MSSFSQDKLKRMIYSQVLSFQRRIPADEILVYRGSPLTGTAAQGGWGVTIPITIQEPWRCGQWDGMGWGWTG